MKLFINDNGVFEVIELKEDRWAWVSAGLTLSLVLGYLLSFVCFVGV